MGVINKLDIYTSNRIAAGEVVERPASIVKELIENSLDAGSSAVTIELKNGGTELIRVTDNGCGIAPDDAVIAFERHATSKIKDPSDLDAIATLGFRGEALASIAAVCRVELRARQRDAKTGFYVRIEGGEVIASNETGCPEGTNIVARDLFFNTPARMKFLKKPAQEAGAAGDYVSRMILARPDVAFRFISGEKLIYQSPGNNSLAEAMYVVYGRELFEGLKEVDFEQDGIKVNGYISRSDISRPNRNAQSFFVNGRYVKSGMLSAALQAAYGTRLMAGRFPVCALNIRVPYSAVDVNIHPNKLEVRFGDEQYMARLLASAVEAGIGGREAAVWKAPEAAPAQLRSSVFKKEEVKPFEPIAFEASQAVKSAFTQQAVIPERKTPETVPAQAVRLSDIPEITAEAEQSTEADEPAPDFIDDSQLRHFNIDEEELPGLLVRESGELSFDVGDSDTVIIGQLFMTYVLVQQKDELYMIDQHAAHERMLYDALVRDCGSAASQRLLMPDEITLAPEEYACYQENKKQLELLGFDFAEKENCELDVTAVPSIFCGVQPAGFLHEALAQLMETGNASPAELKRDVLAQTACKHAVKGCEPLTEASVKTLLARFASLGVLNCPHGRPIVVKISRYEIEKLFRRVV